MRVRDKGESHPQFHGGTDATRPLNFSATGNQLQAGSSLSQTMLVRFEQTETRRVPVVFLKCNHWLRWASHCGWVLGSWLVISQADKGFSGFLLFYSDLDINSDEHIQ
jgi:hypothetical protein